MGFLIQFFLKNGIRSKRTVWMAILGLLPVICVAVLLPFRGSLAREGIELAGLYPRMSFFLYFHFLLPLTAVFMGAAIIGDEVDDRTLPYLVTRPVPRWQIILSKTAAAWMTLGAILTISLALTYGLSMSAGDPGALTDNLNQFFRGAGVMLLGLLVYIPLFGCFGGFIKRPVMAGLLFSFGWESTAAFFPGNVKYMTVSYYLHVLAPPFKRMDISNVQSALLSFATSGKSMSPALAILILVLLGAVFAALLGLLLYLKEYRLEQS